MKARQFLKVALPFVLAVVFVAAMASTAFATPSTLPLTVTTGGKSFPCPSILTSGSVVETDQVTAWIGAVAGQVDSKVRNESSWVDKKKKKIKFLSARIGYKVDRAASVTLLCTRLASVTTTSDPATLALPTTVTKPKITKLPKQILVVQSERRIYLYDDTKIIKTYRCAVGQKAYPTPNGTFHIGKKVKNPSWTNGGMTWAAGMPSYIGPGPNNPLGTRAMYLYKGASGGSADTGVRFHGVPPSENSSIGHAASHGCLRMHRKDVEDFFTRVTVGTVVYIIP